MAMISDIDEYGFVKSEQENLYKQKYYEILSKRALRWNQVFGTSQIERGRTLRRFIRKGIPLSWRSKVWMLFTGYDNATTNLSLYNNLLASKHETEIVEIVKIDLHRTFPENIYFDVHKNQLFNILVAYAQNNPDVGYCQGLNYLAGLIIIVTKDEIATFWLLKHLVEKVAVGYHTKTMKGLQRDIYVIEQLITVREPLLNEKIKELGIPWAVILTKWLICLYAEVLPVETVLRIWDTMFAEGYKIIFRAALTIVSILRDDIMRITDISELAELFRNLSKDQRMLDCHTFMQEMFKIKLKHQEIISFRNTYKP